ncbi:MAG: bifunctional glutamate N-acetyltransferase/amino-acid acetyltransferase ArgJ [Pseudomonadota bacterium]
MKFAVSPFAPAQFPDLPTVRGVRAATASRGFYEKAGLSRDDTFLFAFPPRTHCAGVFTQSTTASADVAWCRQALETGAGQARGLVVNSGNSNAFTGAKGVLKNEMTLAALKAALNAPKDTCFLAATGVIGEPLEDANYIGAVVPQMAGALTAPDWQACARAFMTTDTYPKGAGATCQIDGVTVSLAGIAKGSGMIAPNMATMLAYVFTDAAIAPDVLDRLLRDAASASFNAITVDSDTSTSDTLMVFATGESGAPLITDINDPRLQPFASALSDVCRNLAWQIVKDGEGATKFISITVTGGETDRSARIMAADIANSPLVKTALAAGDANWGRVVMAVGKSGEPVDLARLAIWFGDTQVAAAGGRAEDYDEDAAMAECAKPEIHIRVVVGDGAGEARVYTCDLTHAYIDINGAYRT